MHALTLTPELCAAIDECRRAEQSYIPGRISASVIEIPRLALADALLGAIVEQGLLTPLPLTQVAYVPAARVQAQERLAHANRLDRLPTTKPPALGIGAPRRRRERWRA